MNTDTIRKNATFFAKYMFDDINAPIHSSKFHNALKEADIVPGDKKERKISREIIDLLVFFRMSPMFMKDAYMIKCQIF